MSRSLVAITALFALLAAACGGSDSSAELPDSITLVAYESFPTAADDAAVLALAEFTEQTGVDVEILIAGDTGTMLSKAVLTAGNPEGDVMWGIDNTFLSRAIDADVFEPYEAQGLADLPTEFTDLVPGHEATPVDFGDVCINYDIAALADAGVSPPTSFDDLIAPEYAGMLVVENPATSSPGLAFLLGTIAAYGEDGWQAFWAALRDNDVLVTDGWSEAYYEAFTFAGGDRPLVVSYGSSPPFEVLYAETALDAAPTAVVESTCFRQVEFAGVLAGTDAPEAAHMLIDFLISERFQREVALSLFVFPANRTVELESAFTDYAAIPETSLTLDADSIEQHRQEWIDRWSTIVVG